MSEEAPIESISEKVNKKQADIFDASSLDQGLD
jgi:hypothetical protein